MRSPERYFMRNEYPDKAKILSQCVPLIAAHHRGYTVLKCGDSANLDSNNRIMKAGNLILGTEKFSGTLKPLEERAEKINILAEILLNVTALLRVLDGCDVQSDRVISPHYLEYRNQRSIDEMKLIQAELMSCIRQLPKGLQEEVKFIGGNISSDDIEKSCKKIYSQVFDSLAELKEQYETWRNVQGYALSEFIALSLANRLAFKREQHMHFRKHQCAAFVLPVMNEAENTITVKIFRNNLIEGDIESTLDDIVHDIDKEYDKVKSVLKNFPVIKAQIAGGI